MYAFELTVAQIAGYLVLRNALTNLRLRGLGKIPELSRSLEPEFLFHIDGAHTLTAADEPTIASRRTECNALSLEQYNVHALLGKIQCGRQAGESAADDAHIGTDRLR